MKQLALETNSEQKYGFYRKVRVNYLLLQQVFMGSKYT